jgi:hypothetical protein
MMIRALYALLSCALIVLSGCAVRVGPKTVSRDRFDYSAALTNSMKEQMLMNIVKVRYLDLPVFMDVAQVVATYSFEGSAYVNTPDWAGVASGPFAGASGRWAESPTITYNPLVGEQFSRSLLTPVSPLAIFSLVQAGWPIDAVFNVGVRAINGLYATTHVELLKRKGDTDYYRLLRTMRELQSKEAFALRVLKMDGAESGVMFFRPRQVDEAAEAEAKEVRKLLGLNPEAREFSLVFGAIQKDDREIAMLTRSMLEILAEASAGVEVPASDVQEGRVLAMPDAPGSEEEARKLRLRIRSSPDKPPQQDVYAAVHYRGRWFWVDDRDLHAKRGMGFLLTLFTLAETGTTASPPVLTISKP